MLNDLEVITGNLKEQIVTYKKLKGKFIVNTEEIFASKRKQTIVKKLAKSIHKFVKANKLDYVILMEFFMRYAYPINARHTGFPFIQAKWSEFITDAFTDTAVDAYFYLANNYKVIIKETQQFLANWKTLRIKLSMIDSPYYLQAAYYHSFRDFVTTLRILQDVKPVLLEKNIGDIVENLDILKFYLDSVHIGTKWTTLYLGSLLRNDALSTKYFINDMLTKRNEAYTYDPMLHVNTTVSNPALSNNQDSVIKKDYDAIKKLKDS